MGKKAKKNEEFNIPDLLGGGITYVYLVLMMGIFPIYYPGTLIGLQGEKTNYFTIVTTVYICLIAVFMISRIFKYFKEEHKIKIGISDAFMAVFLIAVLISTLVAENRTTAFFGDTNIRTGAAVMLLCIMSYYAVKMYARFDKVIIWTNLLASTLIYFSGILLTCQFDPLNMQLNIIDSQRPIFVSPLGNTNYNVSYISIILPAAMAMFLFTKELFTKRLLMVYLYIGFVNIICLRAESGIVMLAAVFILLIYFALENNQYFSHYIYMVQVFIASEISVYLLKMILKDHMYNFDGLCALLLRTEMVILLAILFVLLFFLQKGVKKLNDEQMLRIQKIFGIVFLIVAAAVIVIMLVLNILLREMALGTALGSMVLTDDTGSFRGYIWLRSIEIFFKEPFINKIFGCGLACFYEFIYPWYGEDMMQRFSAVFYDPHNDFLWVLLSNGLVGAIGFFGNVFSTAASAMKKAKNNKAQIMVLMAIAGFLVQGLVNSYTIFAIPVFFIVLGMAHSAPVEKE